jgi:hypothetical protein
MRKSKGIWEMSNGDRMTTLQYFGKWIKYWLIGLKSKITKKEVHLPPSVRSNDLPTYESLMKYERMKRLRESEGNFEEREHSPMKRVHGLARRGWVSK